MNPARRTLLRNVSTLTATLAGASAATGAVAAGTVTAADDGARAGTDDAGTVTADSAGATPRSVVGARIRTTDRECGSEDWSRSNLGRNAVRIAGRMRASTPCHDAVFRSIAQRGVTLYVTVGLEPQQTFAPCIQCLGTIGYEAEIELAAGADVTDVVVRHESAPGGSPVAVEDD